MKNEFASSPRWPAKLTQFAFALAVALVIARATFLETIRDRIFPTPGLPNLPRGAGAVTSLLLDWLLCLPMLLVILRRVMDRQFTIRSKISHALFAALAIWAAISVLWSSDKFTAVIQSSHLIAAASLMWAMTQLVGSWLRLRYIAGACMGIVLIYIAHGAIYRLVDLPDDIREFQQHKDVDLRNAGWEPGSFGAGQLEKKLMSGEMMGFNDSPNSFAAMIVTLGIICASVAIQRIRDRDQPGWAIVIILSLLAATWVLFYTYSKTALMTPFLAAAALLIFPRFSKYRRQLFFAGVIAFIAGAVMLIGHGLYHGTLPGASLTFRWWYWIGAAKIFEQHPLLGVGWSNFGSHYVGVRLPIASEEVQDPHNLLVRAFVELGIVGGVLMSAWLLRLWWELTSPGQPAERKTSRGARFMFLISGGAILINILASVDFSLTGPDAQWVILLELFKRALFLLLLILGMSLVLLRSSQKPRIDDRPAPWILWATITATAIFLIHNLVDFSFFEAGPMCLLAMLIGAALGMRSEARRSQPIFVSIATLSAAAAFLIAGAIGVVAPIFVAESAAQRANDDLHDSRPASAATELRDAFNSLWFSNADYADRAAEAMEQANFSPPQVLAMYDAAAAADPMSVRYLLGRAEFELRQPSPDTAAIIRDFNKVIELDPNEVSNHLEFADALLKFGHRLQALEQFQAALRYNDLLDPNEPKRLTRQQIESIQQQING